MKNKTRVWLFGALMVLSAFALSSVPGGKESAHIVIFHFNDLHGKIDALAKVAAIVASEREQNPDVFLVSAGDNFSGNPVVDQFRPKGLPMLELFNKIGLDLLLPGNHEFDYGQEILKSHMEKARYRFVCANLLVENGAIPQPPPYALLKTSMGESMAVLGLIQIAPETGIPDTHPDKVRGIRFLDPIGTAKGYADLKKKYPLFIGLTHIGFDQDMLLAQAVPQLDLIIGGHSHTGVDRPREWSGVLVTQAGANGRFLGRVDLVLEKGRLVSRKAELIDLDKVTAEDAEVKRMITAYNDNPELNRVIVETGAKLSGKEELGSLMADAVCQEAGVDIAFQNNGGIRLDELPGLIRLKTAYQLDPFGNQVVRFSLGADEIRSLIRFSFDKRKGIDLQVSGLLYTVKASPEGQAKEISLRRPDGSPLDEKRMYTVGLSSYVASAYTFDHRDSGASLFLTTADCLIRFLEKKPDLSRYRGVMRARVVVENP